MTHEEKMKMHKSFHNGIQMILDALEHQARERGADVSLAEMRCMSEIMANLADVRKDLAKAVHYETKAL